VKKDEVSQVLRGQLEDDRRRRVFLGGQNEDIVNQQMRVGVCSSRNVSIFFGGLEDGVDDVTEDSSSEVSLGGGCINGVVSFIFLN
jgi:hypothetical protein